LQLIFINNELGLDEPEVTPLEILASTYTQSVYASCVDEPGIIFVVFIVSHWKPTNLFVRGCHFRIISYTLHSFCKNGMNAAAAS